MTFAELLDTGWTPPADDLHNDLFAPESWETIDAMHGTFSVEDREVGFERGRGSYR
jgi:hypothetical protein